MSDHTSTVKQLTLEADKLKNEGKTAEAIAKLNELLALEPGHVISHMTLSVLYYRAKQFEESVQHAVKACELEPQNPFNFTALSVIAMVAARADQPVARPVDEHKTHF